MLNDLRLSRLIRSIENQSERESEASTPRRAAATPLPASLISPVIDYLLEPYEHGYWEFRADWNPGSPFAKYLIENLKTLAEINNENESSVFSPLATSKKISEEKRAELLRVTNRLSAINVLFRAALEKSKGSALTKINEHDKWIERINLAEIPEKFQDAWQIFIEKIYFDDFKIGTPAFRPYQTKTGLACILEAPRTSDTLKIVSMQRDVLIALQDFYSAIGATQTSSVRRIFAPDEDLFQPYFHFVSSILPQVVHDGQISRVFEQSLAYYEEDDFQHCISSLGLIAEDYLQRIYTTVVREALPGGLTLGQTVEKLHRRVEEILPQAKITQTSPDAIYDKIKALAENAEIKALKPIMRDLLGLVIEDRNYYTKRLEELTKPSARKSIFPSRIADRLNELLKWRNAASHNSRVPLGAHEADRALFCLISVITWWQDKLKSLDWSLGRVELLEQLLQEAKLK